MYFHGAVDLRFVDIFIFAAAIATGFLSASMMHNASHLNFGKRWISQVVGHLCGFQQNFSYKAWQVAHIIHHQFPDDPTKDPHPPMTQSFLNFMTFGSYIHYTHHKNPKLFNPLKSYQGKIENDSVNKAA